MKCSLKEACAFMYLQAAMANTLARTFRPAARCTKEEDPMKGYVGLRSEHGGSQESTKGGPVQCDIR